MYITLSFVAVLCLINPCVTLLLTEGRPMLHVAGDSNGVFGVPMAVAVFLLLHRWDTQREWLRRVLASVSKASLDMYLCCYIFDALLYPVFMERFYADQGQFGPWFFVIVPLLFLCSYVTAWLKQKLCRF